MFKRNQLYVSLFATSLVLVSSAVNADETVNSTATVIVQNAFDFTETSPLSFGTIRASYLSGSSATLVLSPDGSALPTNAGTASIAPLVAGAPAVFAIANASSFTPINITSNSLSSGINLTNASAPSNTARFIVNAPVFADVGSPSDSVTSVTTDVNGAASFLLGATLATNSEADRQQFLDGTYQGSFSVTVSY